jgi:hypothetical protein
LVLADDSAVIVFGGFLVDQVLMDAAQLVGHIGTALTFGLVHGVKDTVGQASMPRAAGILFRLHVFVTHAVSP